MSAFLWNIGLATVWAFAVGELTLNSLIVGFVLGYAVLWVGGSLLATTGYCRRMRRLVEFALYFLWELIKANLRLAWDVVTPTHYMRPGIIAVPLDAETDLEIVLLANVISLTPGTLSLDVSPDRKFLYVHHMYVADLEREKRNIKDGFERRLLELLR